METYRFDNINEAQLFLLKELLINGQKINTRNLNTLELSPVFFAVTNPLKRITTIKDRHWKLATGLGELAWHLSISNELDFICNYLSGWKNFSSDNKHITGSCYGKKIFEKSGNGSNKWKAIVNLLKTDSNSRRAVIGLLDADTEINIDELDISCTISLQFLIRHGKVDLIVNMRSNDIIWGLPYDFFFFSFLQELMALELNLPIGTYYHSAASLHLYERHYEMAKKIISDGSSYLDITMPKMTVNQLESFLNLETEIRSGNLDLSKIEQSKIDSYWTSLLEVLYHYNSKKRGQLTTSEIKHLSKGFYHDVL